MSASTHEILTRLAQPHDPSAVRWRVGQTIKPQGGGDSTHGRALAYIDARDCEERLDEVMGVNWKSEHRPVLMTGKGGEQELIVVCSISLLVEVPGRGREWIARSDGSGETDFEGIKGAFSKAFVRAASSWGIGRFLYAMGSPKVKVQHFGKTATIDRSEEPRLAAIVRKVCDEYRANPRMRPLVHEEDDAAPPVAAALVGTVAPPPAPQSRSPRPDDALAPTEQQLAAVAALGNIASAKLLEEGIAALTAARKVKGLDALKAEAAFASFLLRKIDAADQHPEPHRRAEWLEDIQNALTRAGLGAEAARSPRDALRAAKARGSR